MSKPIFTVTTVGEAPSVERGQRMRKYMLTMSIRMACIAAMPFVRGWWILLCAIGAIFLPYVAVVIANVKEKSTVDEQPDAVALELLAGPQVATDSLADEHSDSVIDGADSIRVTRVEKRD